MLFGTVPDFCQVRFLLIRNAGLKVFSVKFVRLFIIFSIFAPFLQEGHAGNGKSFLQTLEICLLLKY